MSSKLLVEHNDWDGISEYAHFDHEGNLVGIQHVADHTALVERNKALKNEGNKGYGPSREWKHVASISPAILIDWALKRGVTYEMICSKEGFEEIVLKFLADSDYRDLRVDI